MNIYNEQLVNAINNLEEHIYDDFMASYYVDLLKCSHYAEYSYSFLKEQSEFEKKKIIKTAQKEGMSLRDIVYISSLFESNVLPSMFDTYHCMQNLNDSNQSELTDTDNYYFKITCLGKGLVSEAQNQVISIKSNFYNVQQLLEKVIDKMPHYIWRKGDKYIWDPKCYIDDLMTINKYDLIPANSIKTLLVENSVSIYGNEEYLEDLFYCLCSWTRELSDFLKVKKIFKYIRQTIRENYTSLKSVIVKKINLDKSIIDKCRKAGVEKLSDFISITPSNLSVNEANLILNEINSFDTQPIEILIEELLDKLNRREKNIVIRRNFFKQTLEDIAVDIGATRERVRQIEARGVRKLSAPSNIEIIHKIKNYILNHSYSSNIISEEFFKNIKLPNNSAIFLSRAVHLFSWDSDLGLGFFDKKSPSKLINLISDLPSDFTLNELNDYAKYISLELNSEYTVEEIKFIVSKKFHFYGDYIVQGRLLLKNVLSYLVPKYFPDGFDIHNDNNIELLRKKSKEHFDGYELSESNHSLEARLQSICIPIDRGFWKFDPQQILIGNDLKNRIFKFIDRYQANILPIQALWNEFENEFKELKILNKYHLQGQLKRILNGQYTVNRDYVLKEGGTSFYTIIENYIKNSKTYVTKQDIIKKFPGVSDIVIQQAAANTKVLNMVGYYVHLDNLHISNYEKQTLKDSIENILCEEIIYHSKTVFNKVKSLNSGLFLRIGIGHYLQFFYLTRALFPSEFEYNRPFMAKLGVEIINGEAQVLEKINEQGTATINEIREFAKEVGTIIERYIEFVDRNDDVIIFRNHESVISVNEAKIEDEDFTQLDDIISAFLGNEEFLPLCEFNEYWKLPDLGWKWNEWSLYSIINKYSKLYKTISTSNYLQEAIPLVAKLDFCSDGYDFSNITNEEATLKSSFDDDDLLDSLDFDDLM